MKHKSKKEENWCYIPYVNLRIKLLRRNFSFYHDFVNTNSLNLTIISPYNKSILFSKCEKVRIKEYRIQKRDKNFSNNRTLDFFNSAINVSRRSPAIVEKNTERIRVMGS